MEIDQGTQDGGPGRFDGRGDAAVTGQGRGVLVDAVGEHDDHDVSGCVGHGSERSGQRHARAGAGHDAFLGVQAAGQRRSRLIAIVAISAASTVVACERHYFGMAMTVVPRL